MGQSVLCVLQYLCFFATFLTLNKVETFSSIPQYKENSNSSKRSQNILQRNINSNHQVRSPCTYISWNYFMFIIRFYQQSNTNNFAIILDEEWNINRKKSDENELPLTILNIYESFKKNITINYYEASKVKCYFSKAINSHLGLYWFDLQKHAENDSIINAELHVYM